MKYFFTILLFISITVNAQSTFQLDVGRLQIPGDFAQTSDHGYIVGGNMLDTASGLLDVYALVKIDSLGNEQWSSMYYDSGHDSYITSLFQSSDGNYVFSGTPDGTVNYECIMAKVNPGGNFIWARSFSLPGYQSYLKTSHCLETNDGNYAILFYQSATVWDPIFTTLIKLDPSGNVLWERNFNDSIDYLGRCNSIGQTSDNGFILTGEVSQQSCYLLRTDSSGNPIWFKIYNITSSNYPGTCVKQTLDGGFIITGCYYLSSGAYSNVIKTDSIGQIQWTKTLSGIEPHFLVSVQQTADSNFVFAGAVGDYNTNTQKAFIVKMDQTGDTLWTKTYQSGIGINLTGLKIKETIDGGLILLNQNFIQAQLMKTDANGNLNCNQSSSTTTINQHPSSASNGSLTVDSTQGESIIYFGQQFYPPSSNITCSTVGIASEKQDQEIISLSPNPAGEKLSITSTFAIEKIIIYSIQGKPLQSEIKKSEINISSLADGIYFIQVQTELGFWTGKFAKQ